MKKPLVALIGRPNVGKSTLFNKLCGGKRKSIVKNEPGVTRDRIYGDAEWLGHAFYLVDTGGLDVKNKDAFQLNITEQAELAVELADVVVLLVDGREGVVAADHDAADFLRKYNVPVVLAVNKLDNNEVEKSYEFYELGLGEPFVISAEQNMGFGDLLDEVISHFNVKVDPELDKERLNIAIVGKPNAGKSSLVNRLLGYKRVMVSDVAGTTRDAIDTPFTYDGREYMLIDTAGIRRSDVTILVVDSVDGLTEQDVRLAGFIHDEGKPSIILMNKWDVVEKDSYTMLEFEKKLKEDLKFMDYYVSLYASALTGKRIEKLMDLVNEVYERSSYRISTGNLNEILQNAILTNEPPTQSGRRLKIKYITQGGTNPPTFILFVNNKELMHFSYLRYLENCIRKAVDFTGTPIKLFVKDGKEKE